MYGTTPPKGLGLEELSLPILGSGGFEVGIKIGFRIVADRNLVSLHPIFMKPEPPSLPILHVVLVSLADLCSHLSEAENNDGYDYSVLRNARRRKMRVNSLDVSQLENRVVALEWKSSLYRRQINIQTARAYA